MKSPHFRAKHTFGFFAAGIAVLSLSSLPGQIIVAKGDLQGSSSAYSQDAVDGPHATQTWPVYDPATDGSTYDYSDSLNSPTAASRRSADTSDANTSAQCTLSYSPTSLTFASAMQGSMSLDSANAPRTAPQASFVQDILLGFDLTTTATFKLSGSETFASDGGTAAIKSDSGVALYNSKTNALIKTFKLSTTDGVFSFSGTLKAGDYDLAIRDDSTLSQLLSGSFPLDGSLSSNLDVQFSLQSLEAVPEPTTWVLLLGGLSVLFFGVRKARRHAIQN